MFGKNLGLFKPEQASALFSFDFRVVGEVTSPVTWWLAGVSSPRPLRVAPNSQLEQSSKSLSPRLRIGFRIGAVAEQQIGGLHKKSRR